MSCIAVRCNLGDKPMQLVIALPMFIALSPFAKFVVIIRGSDSLLELLSTIIKLMYSGTPLNGTTTICYKMATSSGPK